MEQHDEHKKDKDPEKKVVTERHWIEIIEPYLKKLFLEEEDQEIDIPKIIGRLWSERRKLFQINAIVICLLLMYALFFMKPYFDATVVILPDYGNKSTMGNMANFAALAGISLGEGSTTMDVYESLLTSEAVLEPVINSRYLSQEFPDSVNLIEYFEIKPDTEVDSLKQKRKMFLEGKKRLTEKHITIVTETKTKILSMTVRLPEPQLSSAVANNMVRSLDTYVRTRRKSNATLQRSYIEKRATEIEDSLNVAEILLKDFSLRNRVVSQSPELVLEQSRLNRQIQIYQTVYAELVRQLEIARIDEIRDMPIVNIQELAGVPVLKAGPKRFRTILVVSFIFLFMSVLFILLYPKIKMYVNGIFLNLKNKM